MYQRRDIKEGMTVRSIDGHKLGKVYAVGDTEFHIEKGLFFPKDYAVRYAEISDIRDGDILLAHGRDSLRPFSDEVPYGSDPIGLREGIGNSRVSAAGLGTGPSMVHPGTQVEPAALRAAYHEDMPLPLRAEEEEARRRAMMDPETAMLRAELDDEHHRVVATRGDTTGEGTRSLDLSGGTHDPDKRGF